MGLFTVEQELTQTGEQFPKDSDEPETSAAGSSKKGKAPMNYHNDQTNPSRSSLEYQIAEIIAQQLELNQTLTAPAVESSGSEASVSAKEDATSSTDENEYEINIARFQHDMDKPADLQRLIWDNENIPAIYTGLRLYQSLEHAQQHIEPLAQNAILLHQRWTDIHYQVQEQITKQREHYEALQDLSEVIGASALTALKNIPATTFRRNHPQWFERVQNPQIPTPSRILITPKTIQRIAMQQDRENTRPEERYDPSNPLWSGQ